MARNEEKHFGKLNRLILQKQREEERQRNPPRPKLGSLHTAAEVKRWIPSIQKEIDFNLKQCAVPHYPEKKIAEFQAEVDRLHFEYKRFVRRLKELDPGCKEIPWQPRAYSKKREREEDVTLPSFKKIHTPVLEAESSHPSSSLAENTTEFFEEPSSNTTSCYAENRVKNYRHEESSDTMPPCSSSIELQDKPLDFKTVPRFGFKPDACSWEAKDDMSSTLKKCLSALPNLSTTSQDSYKKNRLNYSERRQEAGMDTSLKDSNLRRQRNVLGLDYESDSSSDEM
ncbi:uncharacterized protein LOC118432451 isoform X1 [Branchiostoma floridae]|uniref:Uncharacterized protein LOC118432451 isoform X1 n=1 Tax=Branchiostoma floridae TaxID=7739 RepID=A0A9J7MES6_BRAFL|nr:uncharacterized protein LOC118432451 isoform X1 [Branchiostoma floridae]